MSRRSRATRGRCCRMCTSMSMLTNSTLSPSRSIEPLLPRGPADAVGPLIEQQGQISPAMNPLGEEVAHDGLRRRPDYVRLFQFLAAGDGHHRQLRRKTFHVLGFLAQEALRDEQREIDVLA